MAGKPASSVNDAVAKAIQKNFTALRQSVVNANILDKLFEGEVIDQNTYDKATDAAIAQQNTDGIGRQIMLSVRKKLKSDANFFTEFCGLLDGADLKDLSTKLKGDYERQLADAAGKPTLDISQVKLHLENLQAITGSGHSDAESKTHLAQSVLQQFITTSLQTGAQPGEVNQCLTHLYRVDALMDTTTYQWAVEEIDRIRKSLTAPKTAFSVKAANVFTSVMDEEQASTMYHAILCSHTVDNGGSTTDESLQFLNTALKGQHSISEAAMCTPSTQVTIPKFLIARQGATIYVSFQSNCSLSTWQKYKSFEEGLHQQSMDFPLRFFTEELWKGNSIVLTGFSFGGLLACLLAAKIWKLGCVDVDVLKNKLICITFGQPQISVRSIQEVAARFPDFASNIHAVYLEEDTVPRVLKFLNKSCEQRCTAAVLHLTLLAAPGREILEHHEPFQGILSTYIVQRLVEMESSTDNHETLSLSLSEMKGILMTMVPDLRRRGHQSDEILPVMTYMVMPRTGPTVRQASAAVSMWRKLSPEETRQQAFYLGKAEIKALGTDLLQKHNTSQYFEQICSAQLGKQPTESRLAEKAAFLTPTVKEAELHHYDNKLAILLTGENLWFCHHIRVGAQQRLVKLPAIHYASQTFIQFDCSLEECEADRSKTEIDIHLNSYFPESELGPKAIPIRAHKVFAISRREKQLAKLTPTELIELAYVSALLEQHPRNPQRMLSKRFEAIRKFLEEIVTVVPVESALSAIALAENDEVSQRCCKALMASKINPPLSLMLYINTGLALGRLLGRPYNAEAISPEDVYYCMWYAAKKIAGEFRELEKTPSELGLEGVTVGNAKYFASTLKSIFSIAVAHPDPEIHDMVKNLQDLLQRALRSVDRMIPDAISGVSVDRLFQIHSIESKPPIEVLREGRRKLTELQSQAVSGVRVNSEGGKAVAIPNGDPEVSCTALYNTRMLELVERIRNRELKVCNNVLFSFLQENVRIPMTEKNPVDLPKLFKLGIAIGRRMIRSGQDVVFRNITVGEHIQSIVEQESKLVEDKNNKYTAKIQFILQSIKNVSWNNDYPSYYLERQLSDTFKMLDTIQPAASVTELVQNWDKLCTEGALSLVAESHRSLIARWMKCTLMIHSLRQELSKSTAVGVVGLVNSGKSQLVKTLFGVQVASGTRESKRTTVPFMYNLGPEVECLDVIDFPGADDQDPSIPALVNLLLSLAQLVVFVVDYRKAHTTAAKKWLISLTSVPVLVCLTHADKLYAEYMTEEGEHPTAAYVKHEMSTELRHIQEKLGSSPTRQVDFYSFSQDADSILNNEDGRQRLKEAGIKGATDVGEWVAELLEKSLQRPQIAEDLRQFVGL